MYDKRSMMYSKNKLQLQYRIKRELLGLEAKTIYGF